MIPVALAMLIVVFMVRFKNNNKYKVVKQSLNELYLGFDGHGNDVKLDMVKYPHVLIAGVNGTGKTYLMYVMIYNLYATCKKEVDIKLVQLKKTDLTIFKNYKVQLVEDMENLVNMLDMILADLDNRDIMFKQYNCFNISQYNQVCDLVPMKFVYIFIDEFSYLMPDSLDSKEVKVLKSKVIDSICRIIKVGRAYGIIVVACMQRTTSNQLDTDIRSQFNVRISFRMCDVYSSRAILGNDNAMNLCDGQFILQIADEQIVTVPCFDIDSLFCLGN